MPKFDVVIGNPPYQFGKNKLFFMQFIEKSKNIIKENGYISLITPKSWINDNYNIYRDTKKNMNIIFLNIDECSKYFKNVGSTFSYFIIKNNTEYDNTFIKTNKEEFNLDLREIKNYNEFNIRGINKTIIDKINKKLYLKFKRGKGQNEFKKNKDNEYKYDIYLSSKIDRQCVYSKTLPEDYNKSKLIISGILEPRKTLHFSEISKKGVGRYSLYYCNDNEIILKNIQKFLDSQLNVFLNSIFRVGRYYTPKIPHFDFTKEWNDDKIYQELKLTNKEIEYIEKKC
jgi:hypothetical protein